MKKKSGKNRHIIGFIILMLFLIIVCTALIIIKEKFTVTDIKVSGNEHYTADEIKQFVMTGPYGDNTVYLYFKYNKKTIDDIPFIEKMDITINSPTSITIDVYEKAIAGYMEYLGHYIYFDREGIAVESSTSKIEGIPFVTGLDFDHVVLHEKLPVSDNTTFGTILSITQLLTKYNISTDRIYFDNNKNITLYFGDARIYIGDASYIDEKINELSLLLPKLAGYSGVLHMEGYRGEGGSFTFEKDKDADSKINFNLDMETEAEPESNPETAPATAPEAGDNNGNDIIISLE